MICKNCGTENKEGTKFCKKCGNPLNEGKVEKKLSSIENKPTRNRTESKKILAGVCAGLAEKWNINPWVLRIILIVTNFFVIGWLLDIVYIILIFKFNHDDGNSIVTTDNTTNIPFAIPSVSSREVQEDKQSQNEIGEKHQPTESISGSDCDENIKKEKYPKTVRLSTVILAILLTIVLSFLIIFVFLYFNKSDNTYKETETVQSVVAETTEKPTETDTEVITTEAETESEAETEEETAYNEENEEDTAYTDDDDVFTEYTIRLYKGLNYYQFPDYDSEVNGQIKKTTIYTIVNEEYDDDGCLWGKLKSGVGWVNLEDNEWFGETEE